MHEALSLEAPARERLALPSVASPLMLALPRLVPKVALYSEPSRIAPQIAAAAASSSPSCARTTAFR